MAASPFCVYDEWCTRCKSRDTCPDIPVWLKNGVSSHSYIGHWFFQLYSTDCGRNYSLPNGHVHYGDNTTYNSTLYPHCNQGYKVVGDYDIICQADGTWSTNTSCEIVGMYFFSLSLTLSLNGKF